MKRNTYRTPQASANARLLELADQNSSVFEVKDALLKEQEQEIHGLR